MRNIHRQKERRKRSNGKHKEDSRTIANTRVSGALSTRLNDETHRTRKSPGGYSLGNTRAHGMSSRHQNTGVRGSYNARNFSSDPSIFGWGVSGGGRKVQSKKRRKQTKKRRKQTKKIRKHTKRL